MDIVAIDGGHECLVQQRECLVRHAVRGVLQLQDARDSLGAAVLFGIESAQQLGEHRAALDHESDVGIEELEKAPLPRHEPGQESHHGRETSVVGGFPVLREVFSPSRAADR